MLAKITRYRLISGNNRIFSFTNFLEFLFPTRQISQALVVIRIEDESNETSGLELVPIRLNYCYWVIAYCPGIITIRIDGKEMERARPQPGLFYLRNARSPVRDRGTRATRNSSLLWLYLFRSFFMIRDIFEYIYMYIFASSLNLHYYRRKGNVSLSFVRLCDDSFSRNFDYTSFFKIIPCIYRIRYPYIAPAKFH